MANHLGPSPSALDGHAGGGRRGARGPLLARPRREAARPDGRAAARPGARRRLRGDRHRGRPGRRRLRRPGLPRSRRRGDRDRPRLLPLRAGAAAGRRRSPSGCASAAAGGWRLDPGEVAAALTPRTRMVVVCDPVNPFGTVQTRDELAALLRAVGRARGGDPGRHAPTPPTAWTPGRITTPSPRSPPSTPAPRVLVASGLAHGYGMAGARIGALGGPPALVRACLQVKIAAVRLNTNRLAQVGAAAALRDGVWLRRGEEVIRRNLVRLREIARPVIDPAYGFSCVVDVSETGASAQELTVALCRRHVAVYPGDGLGEVGATTTIRLNLSDPDPRRSSASPSPSPRRARRRRAASTATRSSSSSAPTTPTAAAGSPRSSRADTRRRRAAPGRDRARARGRRRASRRPTPRATP